MSSGTFAEGWEDDGPRYGTRAGREYLKAKQREGVEDLGDVFFGSMDEEVPRYGEEEGEGHFPPSSLIDPSAPAFSLGERRLRRAKKQALQDMEVLRISQMVEGDGDFAMDLRASVVTKQLDNLENVIDGGISDLTRSQYEKFQLYFGSYIEILSLLETLINREEDSDRLMSYITLHQRLSSAVHSSAAALETTPLPAPTPTPEFLDPYGILGEGYESLIPKDKEEEEDEEEEEEKVKVVDAYGAGAKVPGPEDEPDTPLDEFECPICFVEYEIPKDEERVGGFGEAHRLKSCKHLYCQACLYTYMKTSIMNGEVTELGCPDPDCKGKVEDDEMQAIVGDVFFAKYQKFILLQRLRADPNVRWCPTPGCENGVRGSAENTKLFCLSCEHHFCWLCNLPWHEGISCKEAQKAHSKLQGKEKRGEKWVKKNSRPCPNCNFPIIKNSGCNHMKCQSCQYDFCWVCMGHFEGYDHFNRGKCNGKMYYSNPAKKAAVYVGIGVGGALALAVAVPVAAVALPVYGAYCLLK